MITIRVQKGSGASLGHLSKPRETIGSGRAADWTVKDPHVDAVHAAVFVGPDGGLWIEDLVSSSGTFVNGDAITEPRRLFATDSVRIGPATVTFTGFLPDGRVPAGSLFELPRGSAEELALEVRRNEVIETLPPDVAQSLAYSWCDRAVRQRLAGALHDAGMLDESSALRKSKRITDRETSISAHGRLKRLVDETQAELQRATDELHPGEERETLERTMHALRFGRDALRASVAPYGGKPGFAVMIGFDEGSEPPPDDEEHRAAHARPRSGVAAGHCVDVARILDFDAGLAEVREQVKELLDAVKSG